MLSAPELIEAELVEMFGQPQIALKLQGRVFANRMMRGQERAEPDTGHLELLLQGAVMPPSANSRPPVAEEASPDARRSSAATLPSSLPTFPSVPFVSHNRGM